MTDTVRVAIATPLAPDLRPIITAVDPRIELLVDDELLPPQRFPGDHDGEPSFHRTDVQQAAFDALLARAEVFYGIPDTRPAALGPAVRANPDLRWVQTMAAGGGAQVKAAGLTEDELSRVVFTTSAGVHEYEYLFSSPTPAARMCLPATLLIAWLKCRYAAATSPPSSYVPTLSSSEKALLLLL